MEKLYLLGHPVAHSKSPVMYNAAYEALGFDWHYDLADVPNAEEAARFIDSGEYLGINITTPYKPEAFAGATSLTDEARFARGVNLLVHEGAELVGHNVDGRGCIRFLEMRGIDFADARVCVCGTGPTALSILNAAVHAGALEAWLLGRDSARAQNAIARSFNAIPCELTSSRHFERAKRVEKSIPIRREDFSISPLRGFSRNDVRAASYEEAENQLREADIIIDATVLGMNEGDPAPFDTAFLRSSQTVMDTVYGHGTTALMAAAQAKGCRTFDGAGMLVAQAVLSLDIVCRATNTPLGADFDELFSIMSTAAGFSFE